MNLKLKPKIYKDFELDKMNKYLRQEKLVNIKQLSLFYDHLSWWQFCNDACLVTLVHFQALAIVPRLQSQPKAEMLNALGHSERAGLRGTVILQPLWVVAAMATVWAMTDGCQELCWNCWQAAGVTVVLLVMMGRSFRGQQQPWVQACQGWAWGGGQASIRRCQHGTHKWIPRTVYCQRERKG